MTPSNGPKWRFAALLLLCLAITTQDCHGFAARLSHTNVLSLRQMPTHAATSGDCSGLVWCNHNSRLRLPTGSGTGTPSSRLESSTSGTDELTESPTIDQSSLKVDRLLEIVNSTENVVDIEDNSTRSEIQGLMQDLDHGFVIPSPESGTSSADETFKPLLGNYKVACTLPRKKNESPAGGKWTRKNGWAQKILSTRAQFQHLVPLDNIKTDNTTTTSMAVCQAVNVVSLDALFGLIRINVMLRGEAEPLSKEEREKVAKERDTPGGLSPLAVRASFDQPRIVFGRTGRLLNFALGPKTNVVLDTTYVDDNKVRLGKGSGGSKFVFVRCSSGEQDMANEWKALIARRPLSKTRACTVLACGLVGGASLVKRGVKIPGVVLLSTALLLGIKAATSNGGIEVDQQR
jgi:hypothetical protein